MKIGDVDETPTKVNGRTAIFMFFRMKPLAFCLLILKEEWKQLDDLAFSQSLKGL